MKLPYRYRFYFLITIIIIHGFASLAHGLDPAPFSEAVPTGHLENDFLSEASGMAVSPTTPGVIWVINDGENAPHIFPIDTAGKDLGDIPLGKITNDDWEDLASFAINGVGHILIADTGNNDTKRSHGILYIIQEPALKNGKAAPGAYEETRWQVRFTLGEGLADCEAVAVDSENHMAYLVTKRDYPPVLYKVPITDSSDEKIIEAVRVGEITQIPQPTMEDVLKDPVYGLYVSQPTAMDISRDGKQAVILTYKDAYWFSRSSGQSWDQAFMATPKIISLPAMKQKEAICFDYSGNSLYVTSEKRPAPIYRIDRKNP